MMVVHASAYFDADMEIEDKKIARKALSESEMLPNTIYLQRLCQSNDALRVVVITTVLIDPA
jgi:hypothetical protein